MADSPDLRHLHLHFDPHAGIAGDMAVAALVDLGVPIEVVTQAIACLGLKGLSVSFETRRRGAFMATGFVVSWPELLPPVGSLMHPDPHAHEHRAYAEIRTLIDKAPLNEATRALAQKIFVHIATVEAARHGVPVEKVGFHEVGAWDSIADIVGFAAAFAYLQPRSVSSTPVVIGTGQVKTAHGLLPVPAPATAALLQGIPVVSEGKGELTTPTGAAILAAIVQTFGAPPPLTLVASGYGAGTKEFADRPNVLRVLAGQPLGAHSAGPDDAVLMLEANIDDMSGQLVAPLVDALFAAGALDAWSTPIFMKKGRPAVQVSALAPPAARAAVEQAFFTNSPTLGVRSTPFARTTLARSHASVSTPWGDVRIKLSHQRGRLFGAAPEFEDCKAVAQKAGVPVRDVHAAATAAAHHYLASQQERA
ncbi:MAG: nickel pincer cofactor biosynthesis protein LarC [Deltaproteobacteria bacterium]|nr:nickel pincer cofactor biosynthesis protein LarC [Deltaproteobacteria bacterium]